MSCMRGVCLILCLLVMEGGGVETLQTKQKPVKATTFNSSAGFLINKTGENRLVSCLLCFSATHQLSQHFRSCHTLWTPVPAITWPSPPTCTLINAVVPAHFHSFSVWSSIVVQPYLLLALQLSCLILWISLLVLLLRNLTYCGWVNMTVGHSKRFISLYSSSIEACNPLHMHHLFLLWEKNSQKKTGWQTVKQKWPQHFIPGRNQSEELNNYITVYLLLNWQLHCSLLHI